MEKSRKLDVGGMPLSWPILCGKDFWRGPCMRLSRAGFEYEVPKKHPDKYDFIGHLGIVFYFNPNKCIGPSCSLSYRYMAMTLRDAAVLLGVKVGRRPDRIRLFTYDDGVHHLNSITRCPENSLKLMARAWNLGGAMAGYVNGNPMSRTLTKLDMQPQPSIARSCIGRIIKWKERHYSCTASGDSWLKCLDDTGREYKIPFDEVLLQLPEKRA